MLSQVIVFPLHKTLNQCQTISFRWTWVLLRSNVPGIGKKKKILGKQLVSANVKVAS